jgi:ABC-type multidrug transport system fused ATPase/permease subunit
MDFDSKSNTTTTISDDKPKKNIIWGYCFEFFKENIIWLIITIVVLFVTNPLEMIVLSNLFTDFTNSINKLDYSGSMSILWKIAGLYTLIDAMYMLSSYYDKIYYPKMEKFIRLKLVDLIFKNIEVNYDDDNISSSILKLLVIPNTTTICTQSFVYWIFSFIITIFSILAYITYTNLEIGLIIILIFGLFCVVYYYILLKIKDKSSEREKEEKILMTHVDDVLSNSLSILSCKKVKEEKEYLENRHSIYDEVQEQQLWYSSKGTYLFSFIVTIILIVSVFTIFKFYKSKKITSEGTIKLVIIILFFTRYLKTSVNRTVHIMSLYGKLEENEKSIGNIMNDIIEDGVKKGIPITGNIEFRNVSFEYSKKDENTIKIEESSDSKEKIKALRDVSFKIKPLDRVAIIGTNGSGKSTIIKLIMGYYSVSSGQVLHDGVNVLDINREYLRSKIAIINQKVVLFNRSIIDNICYGNNIPKEKVKQILKKLHVMSVFKNQPQGLETLAGLHGSSLSGGQKQIIYLLRCYLSNKPIIIMDEPTAAVDNIHKKYIMRMIDEMAKKSTLIVVTHDNEYAASFPTKIYIEDGKIVKVKGANDSSMPYDDYNNFLM